jgi:drug/metabolite transporter (DMT)-like permease
VFLGILLIIAGSALNSFQNVVEELLMKMLKNYQEPHPLEIVGWEGVYGTLLSGLVMLPIVYYLPGDDCGGRQENSLDTLYQLRNPAVLFLLLAYIGGLGCMNYTSMELSRLLSAVVRNLVSAMRTVLVWLVSVFLYYAVGQEYGEQLGLWSIVELCGFVLLIAGSLLYAREKERTAKVKVKGLDGKEAADEEEGEYEDEDDDVEINGVHNRAPMAPV